MNNHFYTLTKHVWFKPSQEHKKKQAKTLELKPNSRRPPLYDQWFYRSQFNKSMILELLTEIRNPSVL